MVYVPPTVAQFQARFPFFSEVPEATVQLVLDEAIGLTGDTWIERDRSPATLYLTAHLLAVEGWGGPGGGGGTGGGGAAVTGSPKKRKVGENWFTLPKEERSRMMIEHARSGMAFAGRVSQLITVGLGLEDWEWGVTLWAANPDYLKEIVYRMRFDEASARYAEFGPFYTGYVAGASVDMSKRSS